MKLLEMFSANSRQRIMEGIDHPEDLIISQGSKGADRVIQELSQLESDPSTISIKWDGLPALVWGRDKDGEFQLVDKHQFEKISKGKAEFSTIKAYDEARGANRSSLWAKEDILRPVLEAATPNVRDQYWFGDFMYAGTPPVKDGKFVFKPNTVEYRVGEDGNLGQKIAGSQAGMAVHTFIPGLGSNDQPLVGLKGLDENAGVVFFLGEIKDKPTVKVDETILARAQATVSEHRAAVDKFIADLTEMKGKSVITSMSPFITRMLEEDDISGNIVPRFLEFLPERLTPAAAEKMIGKNKDGWLYQADGGGPGLLGIWSMWAAVTELKTSVKQLLDTQMGGSEVQALTDGVDAHEGYVFGAGKDKLKLIDRLGFTKANFARYRVSDDEQTEKAKMPLAAFCFGRMNPPTLGHGLVMNKTVEVGGKDAYIFLSNSQGKDDPLDPSTKSQFIKNMYPKLSSHIVDDYVQGPIYAANWLYDRGFRNITFVGGSDRLGKAPGSIEKLLKGWNSGPVRTTDAARGDTGREYVNLNFVSSGERDPDAPGVTGYSGTKARQAAASGDEAKFWEYTGASPNLKVGAVNLYQATRAGMGIDESLIYELQVRPGTTHDEVYKGWNLRYQIKPKEGSKEHKGRAQHPTSKQTKPIELSGNSQEEVVQKLKDAIDSSKGSNKIPETGSVTIFFNSTLASDVIGHGDEIFADILISNDKPMLLLSAEDQGGMYRATDRSPSRQKDREGHIGMQAFAMPAKEAIKNGLTLARYALGKADREYMPGITAIPLEFRSEVYPGEVIRMNEPGLTVSPPRKGQTIGEVTIEMDEDWRKKLAALGMAGMMGVSGAASAADTVKTEPIVATIVIDGEVKKLDLTPKGFADVRDAEKWIAKFMKDRGIMDWQGKIERGEPGTGRYQRVRIMGAGGLESIQEAPIEMDPSDPMDPMIYGHDKANPGKLKYRMARAAGQLKDLAARVDGASPGEWQRMAQQFEELKMNMEQIRHALEELGKVRKKGGIRSRGIEL